MEGNKRSRVLSDGAKELVVGLVFLAVDDIRDKTFSERSGWSGHGYHDGLKFGLFR